MGKQPFWVWPVAIVVVIGVAAVFYPLVAGEPGPRKTQCLSQLKQLALSLEMYAGDYDEFPLRDTWMDATGPYRKHPEIEHCPLVTGAGLYGYSFNSRATVKAATPATTPLVYDSINLARNASDPVNSLPSPGRHDGRNFMAYVDGHARAVKP